MLRYDAPMKVYEVGGTVRDRLLGLPVKDRDWVVVGGTAAELERQGFRRVGADFPVFLHPETGDEYALARTERKVAPGYKGFEFDASTAVTLEEDLARRDLTINAMARTEDGEIIDPYGGRRDIAAKKLRHVSDAFREDPVRVLRVARFAARFKGLGFCVVPETLALMREIGAKGELDALQPERIWAETVRALETDEPAVYFEILRESGALARVFPEIDRLFGIPQPQRWHPEIDTGVHTMMALREAAHLSRDAAVRFAVLVHDLGKGTTPVDMLPKHKGHERRSAALIETLTRRLRIPKRFETLALKVALHHVKMHRIMQMRAATLHDLLVDIGAFRHADRLDEFLSACEADARGREGCGNIDYPVAEFLRGAWQAATRVTSAAVPYDTPPGPAFGEALRQQRIDAIERYRRCRSEVASPRPSPIRG